MKYTRFQMPTIGLVGLTVFNADVIANINTLLQYDTKTRNLTNSFYSSLNADN